MTPAPAFPPLPAGALRSRLTSLCAIDAAGPDAREFLHGQLSSDVKALAVGSAQYASYNSPKGRMLATLVVWRQDDERIVLVLAEDLAATIARRLGMFVLRAKVSLAPSPRSLQGVLGSDADTAVASGFGVAAAVAAWHDVRKGGTLALRLPDGRYVLDTASTLPAAIESLPESDESSWQWCGIRAGVPVVTAATSDKLIAQGANWELVGGIDFNKGCYPGQEIVARMQYLGRLKERLYAFHADADAQRLLAGTEIRTAESPDGPAAGIVVNAARSPEGGSDLLAVVSIDAAGSVPLRAGDAALSPRTLPYGVPVIANQRVRL
jgi:folate-binding protein YgfZ